MIIRLNLVPLNQLSEHWHIIYSIFPLDQLYVYLHVRNLSLLIWRNSTTLCVPTSHYSIPFKSKCLGYGERILESGRHEFLRLSLLPKIRIRPYFHLLIYRQSSYWQVFHRTRTIKILDHRLLIWIKERSKLAWSKRIEMEKSYRKLGNYANLRSPSPSRKGSVQSKTADMISFFRFLFSSTCWHLEISEGSTSQL